MCCTCSCQFFCSDGNGVMGSPLWVIMWKNIISCESCFLVLEGKSRQETRRCIMTQGEQKAKYTHRHACTHAHTHAHTCTQSCVFACACAHTDTNTHTHAHTHAYLHAHAQTQTNTQTHTHTHTQKSLLHGLGEAKDSTEVSSVLIGRKSLGATRSEAIVVVNWR